MTEKVREELPPFKGQYSDEKVLFYIKENIINYIFKKLYILISLIIFSSIISGVTFYIFGSLVFSITLILLLLFIVYYYYIIYRDTNLIFTTRRIIKDVRTGLFTKHRKELKILDIRSSVTNKDGLLQTLLMIGNIKIEGSENKSSIYFKGIKEYSQVSNYIGRVIDYVKLKGHTDNIARYQNKKYRRSNI